MASLGERWPSLELDDGDRHDLPLQLVRKLDKANADLDAAELAIAKYAKYSLVPGMSDEDARLLIETRTPDGD